MAGIRLTFKAFAVRAKMLSVMLTNQSHEEIFFKSQYISFENKCLFFFPKDIHGPKKTVEECDIKITILPKQSEKKKCHILSTWGN